MILITSTDGKLVQSGEFITSELFQPLQKFEGGDLSIEASTKNIHAVCESLLALFVRPKGMQLKDHPDWEWDYKTMDVVKKYANGKYPPSRSDQNLTRGWCYLVAGAFHRFFFHRYDLYKVHCPLTPSGADQDYHWWLQSKCGKYLIDLTEEQYLKAGIKNVRAGGWKEGTVGVQSLQKKSRNMAYILATHRYPDAIVFRKLPRTGYVQKYPELLKKLKASEILDGFDEKKHASIHSIQFHTGQHLKVEDVHLEKEITAYWKSRYIEFDPNEPLDKPIELIQKASDELFKKSDYFLLKTLVLISNQTNQKLVEESFFKRIEYKFGSIPERKVFDQTIRIRNVDHARLSGDFKKMESLTVDLDEQFEELKAIQEKILKTQDEFNERQKVIGMKNILPSSEFIKRQYRRQMFADFKFDLPPSPWEQQGKTKDEWVEDSLDERAEMMKYFSIDYRNLSEYD